MFGQSISVLFIVALLLNVPVSYSNTILLLDFNNNTKTHTVLRQFAQQNDLTFHAIGSPHQPITEVSFKTLYTQFLAKLKDSDTLTTVVFSGHHGNFRFSGDTGEIALSTIQGQLIELGHNWNEVERLILRGCYTTTADTIMPNSPWHGLTPNVNMIAGYEKKAWDDKKAESFEYILDILALPLTPTGHLSKEDIWKSFTSVRHQKRSALGLWLRSNLAPKGGLFLSTEGGFLGRGIIDNEKAIKVCIDKYPSKAKHIEVYNRIISGEQALPLTPKRGKLRKAYDYFNVNNHCYQLAEQWQNDRKNRANPLDSLRNIEELMPLLFFYNITTNFDRYLTARVNDNWFQDWKNYLTQQNEVALPNSIRNAETFSQLRYQDLKAVSNDFKSLLVNRPPNDLGTLRVLKLFNAVVLDFDLLVMPQRWMTQENSVTPPLQDFLLSDGQFSIE